jgi:hypothetical protein
MMQLPILIRYFQAYDLENLVKNKPLTLVEIPRETAGTLPMQMIKTIANYNL